MDLFEIAAQNSTNLADRFVTLRQAVVNDHVRRLDTFAQQVREFGRVGINARPFVLTAIIHGNKHQNIYEWAGEHALLSGRSVDEILREKLGRYFARRLKFDDCFRGGRAFRYGALNIGGIGAPRYGQFCIVLIADFCASGKPVAFLRGDSLETYMPSETQFNELALQEDAALYSHCHFLAVLKCSTALLRMSEDEWQELLCSDNDYMEAIFTADVDLNCIETVRVKESEYRRLFDLAFSDYTKKHDDATNALAYDFLEILKAERAKVISLERV